MRIDRVALITEMAKREFTCVKLAEKAGISRVTVSALRCGKTCAPATAEKISSALGVPVESIIRKE